MSVHMYAVSHALDSVSRREICTAHVRDIVGHYRIIAFFYYSGTKQIHQGHSWGEGERDIFLLLDNLCNQPLEDNSV